jgi:elongation factor P
MATTADFRNGLVIEFNHDLYTIVEFQHVKPGKGPAFVRTKLKSLTNGKVIDNTFSAGHSVNTARVERRKFQFLYKDEMGYHLMNMETFDQFPVDKKLIDAPQFLKDGEEVEVMIHAEEERILSVELPQHVILKVTYAEPGVKGNTATNASKWAEVETGTRIQVPLFIDQDEVIKVDTKTGSYVERVKS